MVRIFILLICLAATSPVEAQPIKYAPLIDYVAVARRAGQRFAELPGGEFGGSLENAYHFQELLVRKEEAWFGPRIGWKVGYASQAAQQQFGVDSPARGPLFLSQQVVTGSTIQAEEFVEIMLETEVAFTIGKKIDRQLKDVAELKQYVRFVHPAFDASDYRFPAGARPTPANMIATDLGSHRFVLGPGVAPDEVDVDDVPLKLIRNGETIRDSSSAEVMGSPWNSLLWCVNHLNRKRPAIPPQAVPAGSVIVTGTADKAWKVTGDEIRGVYVGDCGPLGQVQLTIE